MGISRGLGRNNNMLHKSTAQCFSSNVVITGAAKKFQSDTNAITIQPKTFKRETCMYNIYGHIEAHNSLTVKYSA